MDTLQALAAFARGVDAGSFSAVAREMGVGQPTVSKLVSSLEESLGVRLVTRGTSGVQLTEEGLLFHSRASGILAAYEEAVAEVQHRAAVPNGRVRMAAPIALGEKHINRLVLKFLAKFPKVQVDLLLEDRFVDPLEERVDIALRIGGAAPAGLIRREVAVWPRFLVASPAYIAARGAPVDPDALAEHEYLAYGQALTSFVTLSGPGGKFEIETGGRYRVTSAVALLEAVLDGAGVALQPSWMVSDLLREGALIRVLEPWTGPPQHATLLYSRRRLLPSRVQVLADFLQSEIPHI
ncbi:LysR family transcriptional regulator [Ramlibacter sp.]|uniref:LysR family transcriptional regulator n=1 Tax=Ramlibacter sp. TaxID=1917967 RepID=UPI001799E0DE|nr:LysR family transcriptional regulator [Ramlibacter sp.]MBA2672366.1 LysR family transcriptional regulator [Ramlibacter sp.]